MGETSIEWASTVWNPVTGCTPIATGCVNCYAKRTATRLAGRCGYPKEEPFRVTLHPDRLDEPLHWRKPRHVFVCSMGDLFHEDVPFEFVDRVFAVMASSSQNTYMVLTKRPGRMAEYLSGVTERGKIAAVEYERRMRDDFEKYKCHFREGYSLPGPPTPELRALYDSASIQQNRPTSPDGTTLRCGFSGGEYHWRAWPLSNVWIGTSCSTQADLDRNVPHLLRCPAAVRFLSLEPLLEDVRLFDGGCPHPIQTPRREVFGRGVIDWIIVGGESCPGARPCRVEWIRSVVGQCQDAGVSVFVKQLGACHCDAGSEGLPDKLILQGRREFGLMSVTDPKGANPDEWPEDLRVREMP